MTFALGTLPLLTVAFATASAFAAECPNLTGAYLRCQADTLMDDFQFQGAEIATKVSARGEFSYELALKKRGGLVIRETLIADGKTRTEKKIDEEMGEFDESETTECLADGIETTRHYRFPHMTAADKTRIRVDENGELLLEAFLDATDAEPVVTIRCDI